MRYIYIYVYIFIDIGPKELEHGRRMIDAGPPSFFGSRHEGRPCSKFLASALHEPGFE